MRLKKALITAFMVCLLVIPHKQAKADDLGLIKARGTAYCVSGITKSGAETRQGVCSAKEEWLGKTVVIYKRLPDDSIGDMVGIYECLDTGGTEAIQNGNVIDVWQPDLDHCQSFMDILYEDGCEGKIYIQLLEAEG